MVLLFDEADALFGTIGGQGQPRPLCHLEVGYLLQRLESFAGLAVRTTNSRSSAA